MKYVLNPKRPYWVGAIYACEQCMLDGSECEALHQLYGQELCTHHFEARLKLRETVEALFEPKENHKPWVLK
jgi:hypothetical protein